MKRNILLSLLVFAVGLSSYGQTKKKTTAVPVPTGPDIQKIIQEAHDAFKSNTEGKNADYIPYLAKVDSKMFGIVVVTPDGKIYEVGETKYEFGIESISKVFMLCLATQTNSEKDIVDKIGVNATGLAFNSVGAIELEGKRPVNPFVNAGAMATASLVTRNYKDDKWTPVDQYFDKFAARDIKYIEELYKSEAETNQHNKAIAMLLLSYDHMYDDPLVACDIYTKQCSFGVNAKDLAVMAATLANGGVNPINKEKLVEPKWIPKILAIMGTAGLYETTGEWMYRVGLPSKSGVGGGIISVIPGKYGIAVFAPPLDKAGNSVKAQDAIAYIADKLNANVYAPK